MANEVKKWVVTGQRPQMLTLNDGETKPIHKDHEPVKVQKDRHFRLARDKNALQAVWVEEEEDDRAEAEPTNGERVVSPGAGASEALDDVQSSMDALDSDSDSPMMVSELDLSGRVVSVLEDAGVSTVADLEGMSDEELTDINDIGESRLEEIRDALSSA